MCVALGNRREAGAVPALARTLASDPEPLVRGHAAWALGEIGAGAGDRGGSEIGAALALAATRDGSAEVREEAMRATGRLS